METKCPVCGSVDVKSEKVEGNLPVPYGTAATFTETVYTCLSCGESGDFTGDNHEIVHQAIRKSEIASAASILENFAANSISSAYFERALRLPARTTTRWKAGELSAAVLALLRIVRTYPWTLEVADSFFDPQVANAKVVEAAARVLSFYQKAYGATVDVTRTSSSFNVNIALPTRDENPTSANTVSGQGQVQIISSTALCCSTCSS